MKYLLLCWLVISSLFTQAETYIINKDHSEIHFSVPYMVVSEVMGHFSGIEGRFEYNPESEVISEVTLSFKVRSLYTGNSIRDRHLKSPEFFSEKSFPSIFFHATKVYPEGKRSFRVVGTVNLKNKEYPLSFNVSLSPLQKDTWSKFSLFAKFEGSLNREDLRLSWNKTLTKGGWLVGKQVKVWGVVQAQPKGGLTPSSKHTIPDSAIMRKREKVHRGEIQAGPLQNTESPNPKKQRVIEKTPTLEVSTKTKQKQAQPLHLWLPLIIIGLLSMGGVTGICIWLKYLEQEKKCLSGFVTDSLCLSIVVIYAWAFYLILPT